MSQCDDSQVLGTPRVARIARPLPRMISYAQNFEDVMLRRALQDIDQGFYVDIGAWDATEHSVTRWFYDKGWRGVNVEPDPKYHAALVERRPDDDNVGCAIGEKSGTAFLHIVENTGLSTVSEAQALAIAEFGFRATKRVEVPCLSLNDLFDKHVRDRVVDFLKIDAEGAEPEILKAAQLQTCRPRILLVEATRPTTQDANWATWEPRLLDEGYLFAWFDGLNRFYVRREDAWRLEFFRLPPCSFDSFECHNARVAELERQLAALRAGLPEVYDERDRFRQLLTTAETTVTSLEATVNSLQSSRSWRFTAPFRAIAQRLRG